ncbi:MAG: hypothetical protein FWF47_06595, partial [Clostridia bacterium]|nr:hypothetical protein [Clostridia bacterium]
YRVRSLIPASEYHVDATQEYDEYGNFIRGTVEEKAAFSAKWKPVADRFLAENPDIVAWLEQDTGVYSSIIFTRHVYGIPSDNAIPQEKAIQIAKEAYLNSGVTGTNYLNGVTVVTEEMIRERCEFYAFYDVTNEDNPLWKITINYASWHNVLPLDNVEGYHVVMNAFTGQILSEYTYSGSGQYEGPLNSFRYAEELL